jgi:uncharacterized protein (TIGR02117 family)
MTRLLVKLKIVSISLILLLFNSCLAAVESIFPPPEGSKTTKIFIVGHGWHTGIVIPITNISEELIPEASDFQGFEYIEIGSGDEAYYRSERPSLWLGLKALFLPSPSVLHVVGIEGDVKGYFSQSDILKLELSDDGFSRLCEFIGKTFLRANDNERASPLGKGIYGNSLFYKAKGYYVFPKTCNVWTANAIRRSGAPITPLYAITAGNVLYQVGKFSTNFELNDVNQ